MYLRGIFILLLEIILVSSSKINENILPMFEPIPSTIIYPSNSCSSAQISKIMPFQSSGKYFLAIAYMNCGINIFDISDLKTPSLVYEHITDNNGQVQGLSLSHNNSYLWICQSDGYFQTINISVFPYQVELQGFSKTNAPVYQITADLQNNDLLYFLCFQQIQFYSFNRSTNTLTYLNSVTLNALLALKVEFIRNGSFALVVTPDQGVQFFVIQQQQSNNLQINLLYQCSIKPNLFDTVNVSIINDNTIIIMQQYDGIYMYDITNFFQSNQCLTHNIITLSQTAYQGNGGSIILSTNKLFLFALFKSIGIQIYDISNNTFEIAYTISEQENYKDLQIDSSESLIFYASATSVKIFAKTQPSLNLNIPNLYLNLFQQNEYSSINSYFQNGSIIQQCIWSESSNNLYLNSYQNGVKLFSYQGGGLLQEQSALYSSGQIDSTDTLLFLSGSNLAYLSRHSLGFSIIDFTNPLSPSILKQGITMNSSFVSFQQFIFYGSNSYGIVANGINALLFSLSNQYNPIILSTINIQTIAQGETKLSRLSLSLDSNYVFLIAKTFGILVYNISKPSNPTYVSQLPLYQIEDFKLLSSGVYGIIVGSEQDLLITEISNTYQFSIISNMNINGTSKRVVIMNNEQYIIVTSQENPTISIVNISNLQSPFLFQQIRDTSAISFYDICLSSDNSQMFITSYSNLFLLQLNNQIVFHTQIYQIQSQTPTLPAQPQLSSIYSQYSNNQQIIRSMITNEQPFQVGQNIEIYFIPVYQQYNYRITEVNIYDNFSLQTLPSYITLEYNPFVLKIYVDKNLLQQNKIIQNNSLRTISLLIYQQIQNGIFINNSLNINQNDSLNIYSACVSQGYIDKYGYIDSSYSPNKIINLGTNQAAIMSKWTIQQQNSVLMYISYQLNLNIINYSFSFSVSNSLVVNLTNDLQYISTNGQYITITLTLDSSYKGLIKFVKLQQYSTLIHLTQQQDQITLSGTLSNINQDLIDNIFISFGSSKINSQTLIKIVIEDGINYNYENTLSLSDISFIGILQPIQVNNHSTIQQDFNSVYPKGVISIESQLYYRVNETAFMSSDLIQIQFQIQIQNKYGAFVDIDSQNWLQYEASNSAILGTPPFSLFNTQVVLRINATDGYSYATDTLVIKLNGISFTFLTIIIFYLILGILLAIFLINNRYIIYSILFKITYTYSTEVAYVGQEYKKQMVLSGNSRELAIIIFNSFLNSIGPDNIKQQIEEEMAKSDYFQHQSCFNISMQQRENRERSSTQQFYQEVVRKVYPNSNIQKKTNLLGGDERKRQVSIKSSKSIEVNSLQSSVINYLKNYRPRNISVFSQNSRKSTMDGPVQSNLIQENTKNKEMTSKQKRLIAEIVDTIDEYEECSKENAAAQRFVIKQLNKQSNMEELNEVNQAIRIFDIYGRINFQEILYFMKKKFIISQSGKGKISNEHLKQLDNPCSILSIAIYSLLVEYIVDNEKVTKNMLEWFKDSAEKHMKKIDWYKIYLKIQPQFEEIILHPYPDLSIYQQTYQIVLKTVLSAISKYTKKIKFSEMLLQESIKVKAYGFSRRVSFLNQMSGGESIHCNEYEIKSIKSYYPDSNIRCCYGIQEWLDIQHREKSLIDNKHLPVWMNKVDLIDGVLMVSGTPHTQDVGTLIIKLFNKKKRILLKYELEVLPVEDLQYADREKVPKQLDKCDDSKKRYKSILKNSTSHIRQGSKSCGNSSTQNIKPITVNIEMATRQNTNNSQVFLSVPMSPVNNSSDCVEFFEEVETVTGQLTEKQQTNMISKFENYSQNTEVKPNQLSGIDCQIEKDLLKQKTYK